jgi:hypothetical protein
MILGGTGLFLWIIATILELFRKSTGDSFLKKILNYFVRKQEIISNQNKTEETVSAREKITIESLEAELGITPDVYLGDRISRIHEALSARREGTKLKKRGVQ